MNNKEKLLQLTEEAFRLGVIRRLVFSRPKTGEIQKISGRLCTLRGQSVIALEYSLPGNTVSHKNVGEDELCSVLGDLTDGYNQVNLITTLGEAELRITKSGNDALLGYDKLWRKLQGDAPSFEKAIEALDREKTRFLQGNEDFLISLGISDKNGRIHDKKQGKFRQINRFIEYLDGVYDKLPTDGEIVVYDLCCGKSYLSFAVYYYLTKMKGRKVKLLGMDLKRDVITWCSSLAQELGWSGMHFVCDDVRNTPRQEIPDMVISLHACDIATDIVLDRAIELGAKVILSTPCCHRYLNDKISNEALRFVTDYPHLKNKLCEAVTDAIRVARLTASGYAVTVTELTDPDDTPKNTLIRALKNGAADEAAARRYSEILSFVLGSETENYLKEIKR